MSASFRPFLAETRKGLYITIKLIDKLKFVFLRVICFLSVVALYQTKASK